MLDVPNMTLVSWLVVGAIAGFLASVLMDAHEGVVVMIVLGIVGAVVGGWLASDVFHVANVTGMNATSVVVATIGAIVVIAVVEALGPHRRRYWR